MNLLLIEDFTLQEMSTEFLFRQNQTQIHRELKATDNPRSALLWENSLILFPVNWVSWDECKTFYWFGGYLLFWLLKYFLSTSQKLEFLENQKMCQILEFGKWVNVSGDHLNWPNIV